MRLAYQAVDAAGKSVSGTTEANDVLDAIESLRRRNLFVTKIDPTAAAAEAHGGAPPRDRRVRRWGRTRRMKQVALFARQLHVRVSTGTPLVDALCAMERQAKEPAWKAVVGQLRLRVEQGDPLSKAMEAHPDYFDAVSRSLVAAGESGGSFEVMLDRVSSLLRKQVHTRSAIAGAMIYPSLLIVVAVAVLILMLTFVLPRFAGLFQSLEVPLPPTTKFLMVLSHIVRSYWWALLMAIVAAVVAAKFWLASDHGRQVVHSVAVRGPLCGRVVRSFTVARFVRVLGVLLNGKVTMLEALGLARQTVVNMHYQKLVVAAEAAVTRGSTVSSVFASSDLIEPSLTEAIRSGEQTAQLGTLLLNMAEFLDEENEVIVRSLTSIIEPVILIGLGLLVGFIAMSMFLPLFDLTSMTQRGG